jgi:phosphate uptake regulator
MNSELLKIATRVAIYEKLDQESEPDYHKLLLILQQQVRNTFKDLIDAVKDENETNVLHTLHMLMEQLENVYKYMGLREFKMKLKNLVDQNFV